MGMGQPSSFSDCSDDTSCKQPAGWIPFVCETVDEIKPQLGPAGGISDRKGHGK